MIEATSAPVIMVVYGTRPEAIKVAPVIHKLEQTPGVRVHTVVTGQHREMLDQVNQVFGIEPNTDLDIMSHGQSLNHISARVLEKIDPIYEQIEPAAVLVQGDTTTVLAAALAAFNRGIPIVHLEAGLRSGDLSSPYPEEGNRKLVSQIATLHLAPTDDARRNLVREGVASASIVVTGNTVIDALQWVVRQPLVDESPVTAEIYDYPRMVLLTTHRRENIGPNMENIGRAVQELAVRYPDVLFVWPAHKNPLARQSIDHHVHGIRNIIRMEPVSYGQFARLMSRAYVILTDSGGIQEEAPALDKPVIVLRTTTERPEAVAAGAAQLVGTDTKNIVQTVAKLLSDPTAYDAMANAVSPYGDGNASEYSVAAVLEMLGLNLGDTSPDQVSQEQVRS